MFLKKATISATLLLYLTGCGDSEIQEDRNYTTKSRNSNEVQIVERMERGKLYRVYSGDELKKISENPLVEVKMDLKEKVTYIKLIEGEASIIRARE